MKKKPKDKENKKLATEEILTPAQMGKKGGLATKKKYGSEYYRTISLMRKKCLIKK